MTPKPSAEPPPVLALDIGGTKIAAALVDGDGTLRRRAELPTPRGVDGVQIWEAVLAALNKAGDGGPVSAIGVACAGPVDLRAGTVSPINIPGWRRFALVQRLAEAVPDVPVLLAADGVCMALGEHHSGAGAGSIAMLGMVVSTGVGGGLVLGGRGYPGPSGNAGHIGHVIVEPDGRPCTCGGRGCLETVASGASMVEWARRNGWHGDTAVELGAAAGSGDRIARAAFERGGSAVGRVIAGVAAVCDLELAVIGGGVAKSGELLFEPVRHAVAEYARLDYLADLRVLPATLGGDAGLVGAAQLPLLAAASSAAATASTAGGSGGRP